LTGRYEELTSDIDRAKDEQKRLTKEQKESTKQTKLQVKQNEEAIRKQKELNETIVRGSKIAVAAIIAASSVFIGKTTLMASDAEELENKFSVVFGDMSQDTDKWIADYAEATARGVQTTKEYLATLQDIQTGFGASIESAAEFNKVVVGVTNDLVSFSNVPFEKASNAIQSGLTGQFEALRSLGVALNVNIINHGDYAEALGKSWQEMSNLEKREAILTGIMQQSKNAIGQNIDSWRDYNFELGDAANTAQSFANQRQELSGLFEDIGTAIGKAFLPMASEMLTWFNDALSDFRAFVSDGEKLSGTLEIIGLSLAGVTAGLVTFLAVAKGAAIINALKTAFIGLNAAIAANPIGAIAVVATTVLVPALIYLYKNWDTVSVAISEGVAVMRERFLIFASKIREGWIVSINAIKMAFISLGRLIVDKIFSKLQDFFEFLSGVPLIGDMFQGLSDKIGGIGDSFDIAAQAALLSSQSEIRAARKAGEEIRKQSEENITQIHKESEERRKAVEEAQENVPDTTTPPAGIPLPEVGGGDDGVKSLTDRLEALQNVEAIAYEERLTTFRDFLSARMEQEQITGADREQFILAELERIRNLETISEEERQAALAAANQELNNIRTEDAQRAREIVEQKKEDERVAAEERIRLEAQIRDARISIMEEGRERFMSELTLEIDALRQKGLSEIELERYKQDQITEYEKEQLEARKQAYLDTYNEIQGAVSSVWSSLNKIKSNQADAEIATLERTHENQIKLLEDSGASEEEITKKKGELASDLEQRKKEIARDEAIREKRMNLFTAVTSTAAAIAKALPNLLLAGLAGAMGAAQIAAINSTPIPKAQTGTPIDGYTIPDTGRSAKADRVGVMASPGETVSVIPRGERRQQRTIVQIGERVILDVVKDAIDNGDLIISTENIQGTA
jgi:hypothetical protein